MNIQLPSTRFGKATFVGTNGDQLKKKLGNPANMPHIITHFQTKAAELNDRLKDTLDAFPGNFEFELSASHVAELGANSFGALASNPYTVTVYEVNPDNPEEKKVFSKREYLVQDLGSWTSASSGEGLWQFAWRVIASVKKPFQKQMSLSKPLMSNISLHIHRSIGRLKG